MVADHKHIGVGPGGLDQTSKGPVQVHQQLGNRSFQVRRIALVRNHIEAFKNRHGTAPVVLAQELDQGLLFDCQLLLNPLCVGQGIAAPDAQIRHEAQQQQPLFIGLGQGKAALMGSQHSRDHNPLHRFCGPSDRHAEHMDSHASGTENAPDRWGMIGATGDQLHIAAVFEGLEETEDARVSRADSAEGAGPGRGTDRDAGALQLRRSPLRHQSRQVRQAPGGQEGVDQLEPRSIPTDHKNFVVGVVAGFSCAGPQEG